MASRAFIVALALLSPALASATDDAVERRTVNDGNVVLEDVPEIPEELAARLHRYQNTRGASFQDWAAEGDGIYITTRFANTSQIHWVAAPGGARRQLTFFEEPVAGGERRPGGADLAFLMDEGGSEFSQIFLLDPGSGSHRRLTRPRHRLVRPSRADPLCDLRPAPDPGVRLPPRG